MCFWRLLKLGANLAKGSVWGGGALWHRQPRLQFCCVPGLSRDEWCVSSLYFFLLSFLSGILLCLHAEPKTTPVPLTRPICRCKAPPPVSEVNARPRWGKHLSLEQSSINVVINVIKWGVALGCALACHRRGGLISIKVGRRTHRWLLHRADWVWLVTALPWGIWAGIRTSLWI